MAKLKKDYIEWVLTLTTTQLQEEYKKVADVNTDLQKQLKDSRKALVELEKEGKKGSDEWLKLKESIRATSNEVQLNSKKMDALREAMKVGDMSVGQLEKRLKILKKSLKDLSPTVHAEEFKRLQGEIKRTEEQLRKANVASNGLKSEFSALSKMKVAVAGFFTGIGMSIMNSTVSAFKNLISTIQDFSAANSKLAAILGTSKEGIAELTAQAKELGRTTTATASQVTDLQTELAKLGFGKESILAMTPSVLKFSKAVGTDLGSAAAFAGATLRIFGRDASETDDVLATLAISTSRSALDFSKLQASMATIGPVAASFGLSLEDTTAMLGTLANAGFDASSAATASRNILLNLCDANGELARALGAPVTNLDELVVGLKKLQSEGIDLAKTLELTDKRSVAAFSNFIAQADSMLDLRNSITGVTDDFNQMAATMADNAAGAQAGFMSAIEGLILRFGGLDNILKVLYNTGTTIIQFIGSLIEVFTPFLSLLATLGGSLKTIYNWISNIFSIIGKALIQSKLVSGTINVLTAAIKTTITTIIAYKVAVLAASAATKAWALLISLKTIAMKVYTTAINMATRAVRLLNEAMARNPFGLILTTIATVTTAIFSFIEALKASKKELSYLEKAEKDYISLQGEAIVKYDAEKKKLNDLIKVANNEAETKERRNRAIDALNKIIPDYNASLDEETGKIKANTTALNEYLTKLKETLTIEANRNHLTKLMEADADKKREMWEQYTTLPQKAKEAELKYAADLKSRYKGRRDAALRAIQESRRQAAMTFEDWYVYQDTAERQAVNNFEKYLQETGEATKMALAETTKDVEEESKKITTAADGLVKRLKEIDAELKKLRKQEPKSNEELNQIQARIKALEQEKKQILGNAKARHEVGTYREDSLDKVSAPIDDKHQKLLLGINTDKQLTEAERIIKRNKELIRYSEELSAALETLRAETDATHTQTLDKITSEQNKLAANIQKAEDEIAKTRTAQLKQNYTDMAAATTSFYDGLKSQLQGAINEGKVTREAAAMFEMAQQRNLHIDQLKNLRDYYQQVSEADYINAEEKKKLLTDLAAQISTAQNKVLTDTGSWAEKMREMSTNAANPDGLKSQYQRQILAEQQKYELAITLARQAGQDTVALEEEKNRRIESLNFEYLNKLYELQQITGVTWGEEYDHELALLEHQHAQGLISEKNYQKARLTLQMNTAKKYYDSYVGMFSTMFSTLQEAEIAESDAKYDTLISQAKAAGEDTAALEEEKENKKLEIQKKYADVQFATKISEIIANTAVAIMQAFAQLGPIAGAVAAAMLTTTGALQLKIAKAEHDKIKNMSASHSASSGSDGSTTPPSYSRVMTTGYADGGYTGDGARYEVAGIVHRGEYVVPKPIMSDRRVVDAVGVIEGIRRNRIGRFGTSHTGYADGGLVEGDLKSSVNTAEMLKAIADLRAAAHSLEISRAFVVLGDIDKARETQARAQSIFHGNWK